MFGFYDFSKHFVYRINNTPRVHIEFEFSKINYREMSVYTVYASATSLVTIL